MRIAYALICSFLVASSAAQAEIEKIAIPSEKGFSFYWWPKLTPTRGWHQDRKHSFFHGVNALAPDGFTFKNAEVVMYANAIYKPRKPEVKSLAALIENDRKDFEANVPGVSIHEVAALSSADGREFRSFTFFPSGAGNWERVSYGEEGEFYLIFTLSARSLASFNAAVGAYETTIAGYHQSPNPTVRGSAAR
jgi:hypothetical protein